MRTRRRMGGQHGSVVCHRSVGPGDAPGRSGPSPRLWDGRRLRHLCALVLWTVDIYQAVEPGIALLAQVLR